jgi:hypothetical protein
MTLEPIATSLREKCALMSVDAQSFARPLARCTLADCRGMCCYDGVYLDAPTEAAIDLIARARRPAFQDMGLDLPGTVVVDGFVGGVLAGRKTATRPWTPDVADFPTHFNRTCCVFHLDDGRCGLQVLAVGDGLHPWSYKPPSCWLFPITIHSGTIRIFDEASDPSRYHAYAGFVAYTRCGATCDTGQPAAQVLADELRYLGDIVGRDLIGDIAGMPREP